MIYVERSRTVRVQIQCDVSGCKEHTPLRHAESGDEHGCDVSCWSMAEIESEARALGWRRSRVVWRCPRHAEVAETISRAALGTQAGGEGS
jgi:hypothetical protein